MAFEREWLFALTALAVLGGPACAGIQRHYLARLRRRRNRDARREAHGLREGGA
ncbi:MAG TPA: hypothetical protein VG843_06925 [Rhizomicrobium sp.]|jgi:hypothetical protein|nr:hypothetical protein [Rhizomicrobium sp.]